MEPSEIKYHIESARDQWSDEHAYLEKPGENPFEATLAYIQTLEESVTEERERGDRNWKGWLKAENEILPSRVAAVREELECKIKALEAEREKAELIAWGLARYGKRLVPYISPAMPSEFFHFGLHVNNESWLPGEAHTRFVGYIGSLLADGKQEWEITDDQLAILRAARAKEQENG